MLPAKQHRHSPAVTKKVIANTFLNLRPSSQLNKSIQDLFRFVFKYKIEGSLVGEVYAFLCLYRLMISEHFHVFYLLS